MYRNMIVYRIVMPSLITIALLSYSHIAHPQDVPITGLGHVSSVQPTDAFIFQRAGATRANFIYAQELFNLSTGVDNTVLHGSTSGMPYYGQIVNNDIFPGTITTGKLATSSGNSLLATDGGTGEPSFTNVGGAGNVLILNVASNSSSFTLVSGSVPDSAMISAYSGVGSCPSNQVNIGLTRNTAPTCAALTGAYIPGATSSTVGGIELAGVLAGTYLSPTFNAGAVAGHGLAVSSGLLTVDRSVNLSSNDSSRLGANECVFATTGIVCEGSSLDNFQALLTITNPTADRTYTFPDASGTVLLSGGAVNGWAYSSPVVSLSTSTDKVGLGTASPSAALSISANTMAPITSALSGTTGFDLTSADAAQMRMMIRGLASTSSIDFARSEGTLASPIALASGSNIGQITGSGYTGSAWTTAASINMQAKAAATWTVSSTPTQWDWGVTPIGSTTITNSVMRLDNAGHLTFPTAVGAPSVACTGTGTSPAAPSIAGTDNAFTVTINTGTLPSNTGTCTVTFGKAYGAASPLVCMLVDGASAWGNSSMIKESTESASAPVFTFTNDVSGTLTVLTGSSSYKFTCK